MCLAFYEDMDLDGIDTCDEPVKSGVKAIAERLHEESIYKSDLAPAYYLVNKFNNGLAGLFLDITGRMELNLI